MERSEQISNIPKKKKGKGGKNNRRFSDEQIRSLESVFETQTQIEPTKKVEVARELGLQPRQVAIWFQNRRARWKSKQIEKDFIALKASYDSLATRFESLQEEKQSLLIQLQRLSELIEKTHDGHKEKEGVIEGENSRHGGSSYSNETEVKPITSGSSLELDKRGGGVLFKDPDYELEFVNDPQEDDIMMYTNNDIEEEKGIQTVVRESSCEDANHDKKCYNFNSLGGLFDLSSCSSSSSSQYWFNFWA